MTSLLTNPASINTIIVPTDTAFQNFYSTYGINQAGLFSKADILRALIQNHILPNQQVTMPLMTQGASFNTMNTGKFLYVYSEIHSNLIKFRKL